MKRRRIPRRRDDTRDWSQAALRVQRKLERNEEPDTEDLLAVIGEIRDMVVPREWRAPDEVVDTTSRVAPATSVDEFDSNVVEEAFNALGDDIRAMMAAHEEVLSDMVLDAYERGREAVAREPENTELARQVDKMREILEKSLGGPIPTREEREALRRWEEEEDLPLDSK